MGGVASYVGVDLGAESGRVLLGELEGDRFSVREVHRFANVPVRLPDGLHWDILHIYRQVLEGVSKALRAASGEVRSLGVDSWAVDYGLLDSRCALISNPYHYRDARTEGMMERAFERLPRSEIFRRTGIQFMPINTLYQLLAEASYPEISLAQHFLMIPDLLNFWLTGVMASEYTNATTTQLFSARDRAWDLELIELMGIPSRIFGEVVAPGTRLGTLRDEVGRQLGAHGQLEVVAVASHDTASAVVAVPAESDSFAYISSGTWSLVGTELAEPLLDEPALRYNFTNEGGYGGTVRFLRNVMGLWIVQECRRAWEREGEVLDYDALMAEAGRAQGMVAFIDPDAPEFLPPGDMPSRVVDFCRRTGQRPPSTRGEVVRCVLESLALKYRWVVERLVEVTGREVSALHVVGGGSRNALLCQYTADALGMEVIAGPVEATALGNIAVQALGGHDLREIRRVIRGSVSLRSYEPSPERGLWEEGYQRFLSILQHTEE